MSRSCINVSRLWLLALLASACSSAAPAPGDGPGLKEVTAHRVAYGSPQRAVLSNGLTFSAQGSAGLTIWRGKDLVGRFETGLVPHRSLDREWCQVTDGNSSDVAVGGNSVFLLVQRRGYDSNRTRVLWFDCSKPAAPRLRGSLLLKGTASRVLAIDERHALVLREPGGTMPPNNEGLVSCIEFDTSTGTGEVVASLGPPAAGVRLDSSYFERVGATVWVRSGSTGYAADWSEVCQPRWQGSGAAPAATASPAVPADEGRQAQAVAWESGSFRLVAARAAESRRGDLTAHAEGRRGVVIKRGGRVLHRFYDERRARMSVLDAQWAPSGELLVADADNGLYVLSGEGQMKGFCALPNALQVCCVGRLAIVANGSYGVATVSLDDLAHPRLTPLTDCTSVAAAPDGRVGVLDGGTLREMRVGGPSLAIPQLEWQRTIPIPMGIPRRLCISDDGQRVWVANDEGWNVVQLDVSNLTRPRLERVLQTGGFARGVSAQGSNVLATSHATAQLFGADPRPRWVVPLPKPAGCRLTKGTAWVETALRIVGLDLKVPAPSLSLPGTTALSSWPGYLACADGRQVFLCNERGSVLRSQDLPGVVASAGDGPSACFLSPKELVWLSQSGEAVRHPAPEGATALALHSRYVVCAGRKLTVLDRQTFARLTEVAAEPNAGTYSGRVPQFVDVKIATNGKQLYCAALDAFYGVRLYTLPELKPLGAFATNGGDYTGISVDGQDVYVGNNWGGLYRIRGQAAERLVVEHPNPGCTGPLVVHGRAYFQGNENRTLYISEGERKLGSLPLPGKGDTRRFGGTFPALKGTLLYTPGYARVLDVADPAHPRLVRENQQVGFAHDSCTLATVGGKTYEVLSGEDGLTVVDGENAGLVGSLRGDSLGGYYFGRGLQVVGTTAYVCNRAQLNLVDLSQPSRPRLRAQVALSGTPCDVVVRGSLAYVAAYYGGIEVVDVSDPDHPHRVGHYQKGGSVDAGGSGWDNLACNPCLALDANGQLCVGEYYSGLQFWKLP